MNDEVYGEHQTDFVTPSSHIDALEKTRPIPRISIQAFCESEGVAKPIERAGGDRRLAKTHLKVMMGGINAAVEYYQSAPTPNLIIVESRAHPSEMMKTLEGLADVCDPTSRVVIIGHYNDVNLYRDLVRNGISEYIIAPVTLADIIAVISSIFINPDSEPLGKSMSFIGAKGGVGSSTIAHNVAWAMSSLFASEVVIADMDLAFGTANINFDQDPAQGISEAVFATEAIDEVYMDRLLAKCSEHLSLLAAPSALDKVYDFEPDAFANIIEIVQATAPTFVMDLPHLWTGWTRNTLAESDEIVITAAPELANLRNTKNLVDTLRRMRPNDKAPRLIINQIGVPKRPEIDPYDFADSLELEPIALLPFDAHFFGTASNNGRMLGEMDANHMAAQKINEIAHILTGRMEVQVKKPKGLAGLLGLGKK